MARVMVIDSSLEHVRILVGELKKAGHVTMGFLKGKEALEAFKTFQPDLVICEWKVLDKVKGWQLAHEFAKAEKRPYLVALHQFPSKMKTAVCYEFGFDECAKKPLKAFTLLNWAAKASQS